MLDWLWGFAVGVMCMLLLSWFSPLNGEVKAHKSAVTQCEAELPRNQHCELIAVPVTSEEE